MASRQNPRDEFEKLKRRAERGKASSNQLRRLEEAKRQFGSSQNHVRRVTRELFTPPLSDLPTSSVKFPPARPQEHADVPSAPALTPSPTFASRHPVSIDPSANLSQQEAQNLLEHLGVQNLEGWMKDVTGVEPGIERLPIHLYSNQDEEADQAGIDFSMQKQFQRLSDGYIRVVPIQYMGPSRLRINIEYIRRGKELDAVLCHELGHLWTQGLLATYPTTDAYSEGFAELFRSAAALWEKKPWEQAIGCNGFEVLHGPQEPQLIPSHEGPLPPGLAIAARSIVCNRIICLLEGLTEEKLAGVARACAIQLPAPYQPLERILEAIERETNTPGFAERFTSDPLLKFGNLQAGTSALAFPNAAGDSYYVTCFTVTDAAPQFLRSRSPYPDDCQKVTFDDTHFHRKGIQLSYPQYSLFLENERTGMGMNMGIQGSVTVSPKKVFSFAFGQGCDWPAGPVRMTFRLEGEKPVSLQSPLIITEEHKKRFQQNKSA